MSDSWTYTNLPTGFHFRRGQQEAIDAIVRARAEGVTTVLLDAPVGSGKSMVAALLGQRLHDAEGATGYWTTPQVQLLTQIDKDPLLQGRVATVSGRRNYPCDWVATGRVDAPRGFGPATMADEAPCVVGYTCPHCAGTGYDQNGYACPKAMAPQNAKAACPVLLVGQCEYFRRKYAAIDAPLAGMTLAYLLKVAHPMLDSNYDEDARLFTHRDYVFIDEAQDLERAGAQEAAFAIGPRSSNYPEWQQFWDSRARPNLEAMEGWEQGQVIDFLREAHEVFGSMREPAKEAWQEADDEARAAAYRRFQRITSLYERLEFAIARQDEDWMLNIIPHERGILGLQVSPVLSRSFLRANLWPVADFRVLASGTFGDIDEYCDSLGIERDGVRVIEMPNTFPAQNAPIYMRRTARLSYDTMDSALPLIVRDIEQIMDKEPERGFIHVNSYYLAEQVRNSLDYRFRDRIFSHGQVDRQTSLNGWLRTSSPGAVFIGVAMGEGLDLHDETARWQIIVKAPWPSRGDAKVARRLKMHGGDHWYRSVTSRMLWQSAGRVMRAASDVGATYVLDTLACDLMENTAPQWGRERIAAAQQQTARSRPKPWLTNTA